MEGKNEKAVGQAMNEEILHSKVVNIFKSALVQV